MNKFILGLGLVVVLAGAVVAIQTAHASVRQLQVMPAATPGVLYTRAFSTAGDFGIRVAVTEPVDGEHKRAEFTNQPDAPIDNPQDDLVMHADISRFPSGTVLSVRADFLDAAGNVSFTTTQSYLVP